MLASLRNALRRPVHSDSYRPEVDGLRFVAIALVVGMHIFQLWRTHLAGGDAGKDWPPAIQSLIFSGEHGVNIFFIISGYIIALPFTGAGSGPARPLLRNYYLRRLVRIEPPYFIIMTGLMLMYAATGMKNLLYFGPPYLASMVYSHNIIYGTMSKLNHVTWSLEIEIQFYLIGPLLFRVYRLPRAGSRLLLMALGIVTIIAANLLWKPPFRSLYNELPYFLVGMVLADDSLKNAARRLTRRGAWMLCIGGTLALLVPLMDDFYTHKCMLATAPMLLGLFVAAGLWTPAWKRMLSAGWIPIIGGMCYSVYLIHTFVVVAVFRLRIAVWKGSDSPWAWLWNTAVAAIFVLIAGTIIYRIVERPFMKLGKRYPLFRRP